MWLGEILAESALAPAGAVVFSGSLWESRLLVFALTPLFADSLHWGWIVAGLCTIPVLVGLNGFFVAAEFALVAVRKTRIEELVNQGVPRAKAVADAILHLDRTIAATQLGITLTSIALGWVGERALEQAIAPAFAFLPDHVAFITRHTVATLFAFAMVTFLHVVFGELIPKAIALQEPDNAALFIAPPLNFFSRVAAPLVYVMNGTGNWIVRRMGYTPSGEGGEVHSIAELRMIVEDTEEAGLLDADEAELVMNVFELSDKTVKDVMVPRDKVAALEHSASSEKILEAVREGAHTRMPVYEGTLDNIVGVVNTKDLFYLFSLRNIVVLEDAMYRATFLQPDQPLRTALRLFKRTKHPMAVVRDSDGIVLGILTLENVLEEIVGDIEDEHDDPTRRRTMAAKLLRRSGLAMKIPPRAPDTPAKE